MIVPLDTPVATRAENFRKVLDFDESAAYRALQETKQEYPEAQAPPLRAPRLKKEGKSLVAMVRGETRDEAIRLGGGKTGRHSAYHRFSRACALETQLQLGRSFPGLDASRYAREPSSPS